MKNANLINVYGKTGLPQEDEWQHMGFLPVNFRNAELTGANFTRAVLSGADFSGANLTGANFTCAALDGAVFTGAILDGVDFTGTVLEGVDLAGLRIKDMDLAKPISGGVFFSGSAGKKAEYMHHYVMEPADVILLPTVPKCDEAEVVMTSDLSRFRDIDYETRSELISERLKLLLEQYLPEYDFEPVVYFDRDKEEHIVFWEFKPPLYEDFQAVYRNDGIISHISFPIVNAPIVFTVRSPKKVRSIVVRMAVAESVLRRGIFGVKFTKILDLAEA
jgi:hypothetical protein